MLYQYGHCITMHSLHALSGLDGIMPFPLFLLRFATNSSRWVMSWTAPFALT